MVTAAKSGGEPVPKPQPWADKKSIGYSNEQPNNSS